MSQGRLVVRLEQALNIWEDMCFLAKCHLRMLFELEMKIIESNLGPITNAQDFRRHLLDQGTKGSFNYEKFMGSNDVTNIIGELWNLPLDLFSWTFNSRRVFTLSSELQTLLSATTLDGMTWQDVKFPFESFFVELADPIIDNNGNEFDCILVSNPCKVVPEWKKAVQYNFTLFSKKIGSFHRIDRDHLLKLRKKNRQQLLELSRKKAVKIMDDCYVNTFYITIRNVYGDMNTNPIGTPLGASILEQFNFKKSQGLIPDDVECKYDEYSDFSELEKAEHVVASLCLFLSTLPAKKFPDFFKPGWGKKERRETGFDLTAITSEANVCTVSCEHTLSREDQETVAQIKLGRASHEKRAHWRRGHWRRTGETDQNGYPERIWIRPCLVNKHKLLSGSLVSGARSLVSAK